MRYKILLSILYYFYIFTRVSAATDAGFYIDVYRIFGFQNSLTYILFSIILYSNLKVSNFFIYRSANKQDYEKALFKMCLPAIIVFLLQIEAILFIFSMSSFNILYIVQHTILTFLNLSLCTYIIVVLTMYIKEYVAYLILIVFIVVSRVMDLFRIGNVILNNLNFANFGSLNLNVSSIVSILIVYGVVLTTILIFRWYKRNEDMEI